MGIGLFLVGASWAWWARSQRLREREKIWCRPSQTEKTVSIFKKTENKRKNRKWKKEKVGSTNYKNIHNFIINYNTDVWKV